MVNRSIVNGKLLNVVKLDLSLYCRTRKNGKAFTNFFEVSEFSR